MLKRQQLTACRCLLLCIDSVMLMTEHAPHLLLIVNDACYTIES